MKITSILITLFLMACTVTKQYPIHKSTEMKLASIWDNKENKIQIENQLEIKLSKKANGDFEYEKGMTKILATFSEVNGNLAKLLYISYELNPEELQKTISCQWKENTKNQLLGKTQIQLKEFTCYEKDILIKNNQQSYSLWEAWFGFK
ncbi:MAG: hypothetical protein HYV97_15560 [Bdellovibrio sp.]|nr:hypothetical protein [Bdellovibrio sp.]